MAPISNHRAIFNSIPKGLVEPGTTIIYDTSSVIDPDNVVLGGGFLLKTLVLAIEPYTRIRMRPEDPKSPVPLFKIGQPIKSYGVGVVIRSDFPDIKPGDHIYGDLPHEEYSLHLNLNGIEKITNTYNLPWSVFIGMGGMPGRTAFSGWREHSHAKQGQIVFVSGGAGSVGSLVVQLAKLDGLKVIASASTDDKVQFLKEIGVDIAFNYKTTDMREVLKKEGPIDIYWDNVGGDTFDAAVENAKPGARFIECGMSSGYLTGFVPIKNLFQIIPKSITVTGFVWAVLSPKWESEFQTSVIPRLGSGEFKYAEDITRGLDTVGDVFVAMQKGLNKGKPIVVVADE
ncbi:hypothetical protein APHAL10511_008599 [Amanita phalloides]|nr:hypothetical protein APHAL10511_008599 [Amanita phalloides]